METRVLRMVSATFIAIWFAACSRVPVDPETPYIIEGELTGVSDSLRVVLFQKDGRVGTSIAIDTLIDGKFRFEQRINEGLNHMSIMVNGLKTLYAEGFPSMGREIFVEPGAYIKVKGHGGYITTWEVESDVYEQKEYDKLIKSRGETFEEIQELSIENAQLNNMVSQVAASDYDEVRRREVFDYVNSRQKEIFLKNDSLSKIYMAKEVEAMKKMKPSQPWLDELWDLAHFSVFKSYRKDAIKMFEALPDEVKQSPKGREIYVQFNPPTEAKAGDDFPDALFYDLEGNEHHISDFKGKCILLDFWSSGCGPCIKAFPEMKELHEKYQDQFVIISMSVDTDSRWRKASERYQLTWNNWNEGKGLGGLYTNYRIDGLPCYVFIDSEGKIVQKISGFSKRYIEEELLAEYLK